VYFLRAENISKHYSGHKALNSVSINVPENSIFGLLGPNGAGKTSLIRIITQIIAADSGVVYFRNERLNPIHASQTGYLPEERGLYKKMKVREQLIYLARLKGLSYKDAHARTDSWLKHLDLLQWADRALEDLSKGMQQKVQFIAAVIHEPSLLILDEPFTGFDPVNADLIKQEILKLKSKGTTIILSTHRMDSVEELCDHVTLIHQSEKILEGPLQEIKNQFRENIFEVEGKGKLNDSDYFQILEQKAYGDINYYRLKALCECKKNQLLTELMKSIVVKEFKEEIPSMEDIFIQKVKKNG
jgi:ABC-2 type transport system ATP-binding protein